MNAPSLVVKGGFLAPADKNGISTRKKKLKKKGGRVGTKRAYLNVFA
jgi:hypothetical protein